MLLLFWLFYIWLDLYLVLAFYTEDLNLKRKGTNHIKMNDTLMNYPSLLITKNQLKLFVLQFILISGIILFSEEQKHVVLFLYIIASLLCILNTKYLLYIFYSSIWISFKLYFEIGSVIIRLSDIIFLFIFISWLINSFFRKTLIISTPKKNDHVIFGFFLLCYMVKCSYFVYILCWTERYWKDLCCSWYCGCTDSSAYRWEASFPVGWARQKRKDAALEDALDHVMSVWKQLRSKSGSATEWDDKPLCKLWSEPACSSSGRLWYANWMD